MAGEQVVVGLDVGTTKVCTLIAEVKVGHQVQVVGAGVCPSRGLRKGVVVDMEAAAGAVAASLKKAEVFSGYKIIGACVGVSGGRLDSEPVHAGISLPGGQPVSRQHLRDVLEAARLEEPPVGRQVLHMVPRGYIVDGENGVQNPVGMLAARLEVEGLVISTAAAPLQNIRRCVERAGVQVDGYICAGLASAQGVLTETERQLGVLLLDIGGGTTDLAWFRDGEAELVCALPLGGNHVTNDLVAGLGVPLPAAEEIKVRFASALPEQVPAEETVDAGSLTEGQVRKVSRRFLCEIVEARVSEILGIAMEELVRRGYDGVMPGGVVLTGGSSQLRGLRELAQKTLDMPARLGVPEGLTGTAGPISTPAYATAAGLLKWSLLQQGDADGASRPMRRRVGVGARLKGIIKAFLP